MATDNGKFYVGVNGVAQTASKIYLGVNGVAKCVYDSAGGSSGDSITKRKVHMFINRGTEDNTVTMYCKSYVIVGSTENGTSGAKNAANRLAGTNGISCSAGQIHWHPILARTINSSTENSETFHVIGFINIGSNSATTFTRHASSTNTYYTILGLDELSINGPYYSLDKGYNVTLSYGQDAVVGSSVTAGYYYRNSYTSSPSTIKTFSDNPSPGAWASHNFLLPYSESSKWLWVYVIRNYVYESVARRYIPLDTLNMMQHDSSSKTQFPSGDTGCTFDSFFPNLNKFQLEELFYLPFNASVSNGHVMYGAMIHQNANIYAGVASGNGSPLSCWFNVS